MAISVYCAISLDGFIAGENDDLSWLGQPAPNQTAAPDTIGFEAFMQQTGAMLMGRRTFDVVQGFDCEWPYGDVPVFVATTRPIENAPPTVQAVSGDIQDLCAKAQKAAGDKHVYLDGGGLISQALDAGCIDQMILSVVPILLGKGIALYRGEQRHRFDAQYLGRLGETLQLRLHRKS